MRLAPVVLLPLLAACTTSYGGPSPVETADPQELRWIPHRPVHPEEVENLVYDLRIFAAETGILLYERRDLVDPCHRLEEPLGAGSQWTVRARYLRRGEPRRTSWTAPEDADRNGDCSPSRVVEGVPLRRK